MLMKRNVLQSCQEHLLLVAGGGFWHVFVAHEHRSNTCVDRSLRAISFPLQEHCGSQVQRATRCTGAHMLEEFVT